MLIASLRGHPIEDIDTPALLIDFDQLERNIAQMRELTATARIRYRPHSKTHKSATIAKMQLSAGAHGICCATVREAEAMAELGIDDIHITSETAGSGKIARVAALASKIHLSVVVDHEDQVDFLSEAAARNSVNIDVFVEVDVGQGRCGVQPGPDAAKLAGRIANSRLLNFRGLQGYHGKIQMTARSFEREQQVRRALDLLQNTVEFVRRDGLDVEILTGGGSGSLASDIKFAGLNELQPGSYVFMDSEYRRIEWEQGKGVPFQTSLMILGTVISRPSIDRAIVDVGLKAASIDHGPPIPFDLPGSIFTFGGDEHGQLTFDGACPLNIGDKVRLIPSHCDTTANLFSHYVVIRSGHVHDIWRLDAAGYV